MSWPAEGFPYALPLTLGHEGAGTVAALGEGVEGLESATRSPSTARGAAARCLNCAQGKENYCPRAAELGINPPGLGAPGRDGRVHDRRRRPPPGAASATSTRSGPSRSPTPGLTPYHAIKRSLPKLGARRHRRRHRHRRTRPRRHPAPARADGRTGDRARRHRGEAGAGPDRRRARGGAVATRTPPRRSASSPAGSGREAVFDFVGAAPTVATAGAVAAVGGDVTIVGIGGGLLPVGFGSLPFDAASASRTGVRAGELIEVIDLAHAGAGRRPRRDVLHRRGPARLRAAARGQDQRPRGHPAERLTSPGTARRDALGRAPGEPFARPDRTRSA